MLCSPLHTLSASVFGGENVGSSQTYIELTWTRRAIHGKVQNRRNSTLESVRCLSSSPLERQRDDAKAMCKSIVKEMNYTFSVHEGCAAMNCLANMILQFK